MNGEIPVKITSYESGEPINYIIMGIGNTGKNLLNRVSVISALVKREGLQSVFICDDSPFWHDDWKNIYRRSVITKEFSKSDMILTLVDADVQNDFESACMGMLYDAVVGDKQEAEKWYNRAQENGHASAQQAIKELQNQVDNFIKT